MDYNKSGIEIKTSKFEILKEDETMYVTGGTSVRENNSSVYKSIYSCFLRFFR